MGGEVQLPQAATVRARAGEVVIRHAFHQLDELAAGPVHAETEVRVADPDDFTARAQDQQPRGQHHHDCRRSPRPECRLATASRSPTAEADGRPPARCAQRDNASPARCTAIRGVLRKPRRFWERGCARSTSRSTIEMSTRCGWSSGPSRAPLVAAPPRCGLRVSGLGIRGSFGFRGLGPRLSPALGLTEVGGYGTAFASAKFLRFAA